MQIAIIGTRGLPANYGGFETCVDHTAREWASQGHQVLVYCRENHYKNQVANYHGVVLRYTKSIPLKGIDTLSNTLISILDLIIFKRSYTIVHLYNSGNGIFIPLLRLFGKKVYVSVDGVEWKREKWGLIPKMIHKLGAYMCVKFSNKVIVDNREVFDVYMNKFSIQTTIIEYGAKFIKNSEFSGDTLSKFNLISKDYFLFVGRFVPEKGVHKLIETYLKLKTNKPLVIIGGDTSSTDYTDKIEMYSEKNENIIVTGFLYNEAYEELLSNAYLYVSASELEGTSPSLLAALGAKVCTLVNGIKENIQTLRGSGYVFKENDLNDLLKLWQNCEDDPSFVSATATKGYEFAKQNYTWKNISKKYLEMFQE